MSKININDFITPCYIFDENILLCRVNFVQQNFINRYQICFSVKANPFILPYLSDRIDKIEVCSHGEFKICQYWQILPSKIFYTGVNKKQDELIESLEYGVRVFNIESLHQFRLLRNIAKAKGISCKIYPRLSSGNQFGMSMDDILLIIDSCRKDDNVIVEGIHYYAGTAIKRSKRVNQLIPLQKCISLVKEKINKSIHIEYGPGLPVNYFIDEAKEPYDTCIYELLQDLSEIRNSDDEWTIELGRYLTSECGSYLTAVEDVKTINNINYAIVDGGINHLNYYGQVMGMRIPHIKYYGNGVNSKKYWVCGSLCTTSDVLAKGVQIPELSIGDRLLFGNCGAYSNTEANYLFLSRDLPYFYIIHNDNNIEILRKSKPTFKLNRGEISHENCN